MSRTSVGGNFYGQSSTDTLSATQIKRHTNLKSCFSEITTPEFSTMNSTEADANRDYARQMELRRGTLDIVRGKGKELDLSQNSGSGLL
jgi:hypothetical protein